MNERRWRLLTLGLVAFVVTGSLGALTGACGFQAELDLLLRFEPIGGTPLSCDDARVATVVLTFKERSDAAPTSRITRSCRGWRNQRLLIDPGPTTISVEAYDEAGILCYADSADFDFGRRETRELEWIVTEHPEGRDHGCVYPYP
jgi:hypothetical protein